MPSLIGKVILVTGASAGLGKKLTLELARLRPAHIWVAASNEARLLSAIADVKKELCIDDDGCRISPLVLNLSSFQSIKNAADAFLEKSKKLDILVLNAGVMSVPPGTTAEGYEVQFGINHMGHALLTKLLLPALSVSDQQPRVVVLSSSSHADAPTEGIRWASLKTDGRDVPLLQRYGQSKLANVLYARELARRHAWLRVAAVHPGVVRGTELQARATAFPYIVRALIGFVRWFFTVSLEEGVKNQVWAIVCDDRELESGNYYEPVGVRGRESKAARRVDLGEGLWEWTERELHGHGCD